MTVGPSRLYRWGLFPAVLAIGVYLGTQLGCKPSEGPRPGAQQVPGRAVPPRANAAIAEPPTALKSWVPPVFSERQRERDEMVRVIRETYGLHDAAVLKAMATVPRHEFVAPAFATQAYADHPLPTSYGQTISQPDIVAEMTHQLHLQEGEKVLEVGTGSGYQAAVLTHFTTQVYTIEIVKPLADSAAERLKRLGYGVVQVRCGDGFFGWPEAAPFDAILVTFTVERVPERLLEQLKPGGRMVIPVAEANGTEWLNVLEKSPAGEVATRRLFPVWFVPMLREDPSRYARVYGCKAHEPIADESGR